MWDLVLQSVRMKHLATLNYFSIRKCNKHKWKKCCSHVFTCMIKMFYLNSQFSIILIINMFKFVYNLFSEYFLNFFWNMYNRVMNVTLSIAYDFIIIKWHIELYHLIFTAVSSSFSMDWILYTHFYYILYLLSTCLNIISISRITIFK